MCYDRRQEGCIRHAPPHMEQRSEGILLVAEHVSTPDSGVALSDETSIEVPRRYFVLLHNDHYTTMEFVVQVLMEVFRKSATEAERVMRSVHENGIGVAGVYVKAVAEAKVLRVHEEARSAGYPLRCSMEPE